MLDIPADVSVALDVCTALNASGRCREDEPLYTSATRLLKLYLDAAAGAHQRPTAAEPARAPSPHPNASWDERTRSWIVPGK